MTMGTVNLKVGREHKQIQAKQGGIHGNPITTNMQTNVD